MSDWQLAIDFGTSATVAAACDAGVVSLVDLESNGRVRIPSGVFLTEAGDFLVGTSAMHQAVFAPERYEPTPKRLVGEGSVFLGDRLVPISELIAAILKRAYAEACRERGGRTPSEVHLTHPAQWADTRLAVLREASDRAGLPGVSLVPEPVAAAGRMAAETARGEHIAVYDFGGGTFDAAVLRRSDDGFEVAGPPTGRDPLGGEDIDERILDHLGEVLATERPEEWAALRNPRDAGQRRDTAALRAEVQRAKETLSEVTVCQLWVPGIDREVQLTRAELESLIAVDIETTVDTLEAALRDAGVTAGDLAGVYLVGGSSRIPLVADTIWRRLQVRPSVQDNPKAVVAAGAVVWRAVGAAPAAPASAPVADPAVPAVAVLPAPAGRGGPVTGVEVSTVVRPVLAMSLDTDGWAAGVECRAQLVIDHLDAPALTIRVRDEPAGGTDTAALAAQVLATRAPRSPGFRELALVATPVFGGADGLERRFSMDAQGTTVAMFERYLVRDGRAVVLAAPEAAREAVASLVVADAPGVSGWCSARFEAAVPGRWSVSEQLALRRRGSPHQVAATCATTPSTTGATAWIRTQVERFLGLPGAVVLGRLPARILDCFDGEIVTLRWREGAQPMLSKLGLSVAGRRAFLVAISLREAEQGLFPILAAHARIRPEVAARLAPRSRSL